MTDIRIPATVQDMVDRGALVVISHSGGKDSQAMAALVSRHVPADQIVVIHADLAEVEFPGTMEHARDNVGDLEFHVAKAGKTFWDMVERRGMFPSPQYRQCTSDLKRDPINTLIRKLCKERGYTKIVNCMGLRAEESSNRARQVEVKPNKRMSKAGRTMVDWLPIHKLTKEEVFQVIADAGQEPHWAYAAGMTRLSCCFCIMGSKGDLATAAKLNPDLYRRYVEAERRLGFTLQNGKTLEDTTGIRG